MGGQFRNEFERVKESCADLALQMRCPHHFKHATVEIEIGRPNTLYIDIISCCEEFEKRVREALRVNLGAAREEFLYEMEDGWQRENRVNKRVARLFPGAGSKAPRWCRQSGLPGGWD